MENLATTTESFHGQWCMHTKCLLSIAWVFPRIVFRDDPINAIAFRKYICGAHIYYSKQGASGYR